MAAVKRGVNVGGTVGFTTQCGLPYSNRASDFDPMTPKDLVLAVKRQVVAVLGDRYMGKQSRGWAPFLNRPGRQGRHLHALTVRMRAGGILILGPRVFPDEDFRWNDVHLFFDFFTERLELVSVLAGFFFIGKVKNPALTVKLFSRRPLGELDEIAVDGDSHTSVALLALVMAERFGRTPSLKSVGAAATQAPDAVLLIGDKVITSPPDPAEHPYRLDLGGAWKEMTGVPFIFATWMARAGARLGDVPDRLEEVRRRNGRRLSEIAARHAGPCGWPEDLAVRYLSRNLSYRLGADELAGIEEFWRRCHVHGIIDELRPMRLYGRDS